MPTRPKAFDRTILRLPDGVSRQDMVNAMRADRLRQPPWDTGRARRDFAALPAISVAMASSPSGARTLRWDNRFGPPNLVRLAADTTTGLRGSQEPGDADPPNSDDIQLRGTQRPMPVVPLRGPQYPRDQDDAALSDVQLRGSQTPGAASSGLRGPVSLKPLAERLALGDARARMADTDQRTYRLFFNGFLSPEEGKRSNDDTRALFQGLSWNSADELAAGVNVLRTHLSARGGDGIGYTPMEAYDAWLAAEQERKVAHQAEHPFAATAWGQVGEAFSPLARLGRGRGGSRLRRAAGRYVKPVFEGAVQGGFEAEPDHRFAGAVEGATTAGLLAAGMAGLDHTRPRIETFDPGGHLRGLIDELETAHPLVMAYSRKAGDKGAELAGQAAAIDALNATGLLAAIRRLRLKRQKDESSAGRR